MSDLQQRLQDALGDAYRIEREITGGGMSCLFLATEASLERQVVIKLLSPELASELSAARFQREIHVAAQLQHPHILPVLSTGARDGLVYYIMPYVAGESLRHRLDRTGKLSVVEAVGILREIADALAYAHRRGVVHRDIKPANILLLEEHAVLADFGVARAIEAAHGGPTKDGLTVTGTSIGTFGYMAPEQLVGEHADARADIYALALVGYEMIAGSLPFAGQTGQAVFAAHLTETPKPLSTVHVEVPAAVSDAIQKALAKDPDERFQSAGQFRVAIDLPATATFQAYRLRAILRMAAAIGAVLVVLAGAGALVVRSKVRSTLDPNLLAVAPFDVRDADTTWHEQLADLLTHKLDGAGSIRTLPLSTALPKWSAERADRATAEEYGRRTGAGLVVYGSLVGQGLDSVSLTASILVLGAGRSVVLGGSEVERQGPKDAMNRLVDSVAVALLRELGKKRAVGAFRQTSLGATSLPALKAFLHAEQFYRRTAWDSALAYYERAVALDSTFSLAYRHMGLVLGWLRATADSQSRSFLLRAGQFNRGLSPRDSLLVAADSIRAALGFFETDTAFLSKARRLFATLDEALKYYDDDPEVWYALGDARFHFGFGPQIGVSERQVLSAFDRAITLDSAFAPAYIHAVELGFTLHGAAAGARYAQGYLALKSTDVKGAGIWLVDKLVGANRRPQRELDQILDTVSADVLRKAWTTLRHWPDSAETAVQLARLRARGQGPQPRPDSNAQIPLAVQLAYRGHLQEAYRLLAGRETRLMAELIVAGVVPSDSAAAMLRGWLKNGSPYLSFALPWWAAQGDTLSLAAILARGDALLRSAETSGAVRRQARYDTAAARAYLALARRDSSEALRRFEALPDTLCVPCYVDRLNTARLLVARGRHREAAARLSERLPVLIALSEVVQALERGRVAMHLNNRQEALDSFGLVADAWLHADPELQPSVREAREALQRLGGDRPATRTVVLNDRERR